MWEELQAELGDEVDLITVDRDTDEGGAFARSHNVQYQPGFVVLNSQGEVTYAALGPWDPQDVTELVRSAASQ